MEADAADEGISFEPGGREGAGSEDPIVCIHSIFTYGTEREICMCIYIYVWCIHICIYIHRPLVCVCICNI